MAWLHRTKGLWYPDTVTASRELTKLRPCEHMIDEAWRICKICTSVWLCAMGIYARTKEEMEDIEQRVLIKTYSNLLYKVRTKTYRRDMSFYLNVRSCAWSAVGELAHERRAAKRQAKVVALGRIDSGLEEGWLATLAAHTVPKLRTDGDCRAQSAQNTNDKYRQRAVEAGGRTLEMYERYHKASMKRLSGKYREDAYWDYVADCEEFGIEAVSMDEFLRINYEEGQG